MVEDLISIVVPVRNRAHLVERTLKSIADQSVMPRAVILVDNGSTDSTLQVLKKWSENREFVEVISEASPGASCARNAGLSRVKTPYVMFFDSDDIMPSRHVEEIGRGLRESGFPDLIMFPQVIKDTDGRVILDDKLRKGDQMKNHIFHSTLSTLRYAAKTDLVRGVGGWNEQLLGWDDWELGIRLLVANPIIAQLRLAEPVEVMVHGDSITGNDFSSKAGQWERAMDCAGRVLENDPYHRRLIDYRRAILAGDYRREGHPEFAEGLVSGWWMRLIAAYVARGGRGVSKLAIVERFRP